MKTIKSLIFLLCLGLTFFVNFPNLTQHYSECGLKPYPCYSESFDSPIITNRPNFLPTQICGGFTGECSSTAFNYNLLIKDIALATIFFFVILGIIKILKFKTQPSS